MTLKERAFTEYVICLLTKLEPRFEKAKTIIYDELEDVDDLIFIHKGSLLIGYEINKTKKYCLMMRDKAVIGAHDCTFGKKSQFVYTAHTDIEGFFIRVHNWYEILRQNPDIAQQIIIKIEMDYLRDIMLRVGASKRQALKELEARPDLNVIQTTTAKNKRNDKLDIISDSLGLKSEERHMQLGQFDDIEKKCQQIMNGVIAVANNYDSMKLKIDDQE